MKISIVVMIVFISILLITEFLIYRYGTNASFETADMIVVLGSGSNVHGPLLNDRLEAAIRVHGELPHLPILLTGDEKNKQEISSMSAYMKERLPHATLLLDPHSLTTWDSFIYLRRNYPRKNLLVITNEFHQRRSMFFARILELSAKSYGQDHKFSNTWYLFVRERIARLMIYKHLMAFTYKKPLI